MTIVMTGQVTGGPKSRLDIRRPTHSDTAAVLGMVERCSPRSRFYRFHGPSDGIAYTVSQLRRPGDAVLLAWDGPRCVGMGALARDNAGGGDIGVLVEDAYQRRGLGRRLLLGLRAEAHLLGIGTIHADVMGDDAHLVRELRRLGPARVAIDSGTYSVDIDVAETS
jgi:GNAT superfamily N-acetyltransferase